jgi:hypothetical protein
LIGLPFGTPISRPSQALPGVDMDKEV